MTFQALTPLQRGVLDRMRYRGLDTLANFARDKWQRGERCGITLPEHPRLQADFKRANEQVSGTASRDVAR